MTPEDVIHATAEKFGVEYTHIIEDMRFQPFSAIRQVAISLAHDVCKDVTISELSRVFNRDRSTIHHAIHRVHSKGNRIPYADYLSLRQKLVVETAREDRTTAIFIRHPREEVIIGNSYKAADAHSENKGFPLKAGQKFIDKEI